MPSTAKEEAVKEELFGDSLEAIRLLNLNHFGEGEVWANQEGESTDDRLAVFMSYPAGSPPCNWDIRDVETHGRWSIMVLDQDERKWKPASIDLLKAVKSFCEVAAVEAAAELTQEADSLCAETALYGLPRSEQNDRLYRAGSMRDTVDRLLRLAGKA